MNIAEQLSDLERQQAQLELDRLNLVEKGLASTNVDEMIKAMGVLAKIEGRKKTDRGTYIIDPMEMTTQFGYRDRVNNVTYETLARMAKTPIINAIIKTRVNQIASFSNPQYDRHSVGFVLRKKEPHFFKKVKKLTRTEEKEIEQLTTFLMRCGKQDNWIGEDFDAFLRIITQDSFIYDQMCFQVVFDRKGLPAEFLGIDAGTIRLAESYDDETYKKKNVKPLKGYYPSYVQLFQGRVYEEFYPWEMCFGVRNPNSSIHNRGYGVSELEDLVNIVTSLLWSEEYNRRFFSQGAAPKGIIAVKGNGLSNDSLQKFRQEWQAMVSGVQNAWKTPVMETENMQWIDLQKSNQDMEFAKWIEFLIKIASAVYNIDPAEVNFPYSGGDSKPLFEGNNEARLKFSKDKGLKPTLKLIEAKINRYIVNYFYEGKYEFKFVGLESSTMQEETDLLIKQVTSFKTLNEARREFNLPEIEGGDIVLNATYMSKLQMDQQAEMQAMQMAMETGQAQPVGGSGKGDDDKDSDRANGGFSENPSEGDENVDTTEGKNPVEKALNDFLEKNGLVQVDLENKRLK